MASKAVTWGLTWDAAVEAAVPSQRWVLSAMQTHGPALIRLLWRILGNEQDVCDAYQDTFLQLAHRRQGRKPDHIRAFVFRTASNVAVRVLRRKKCHETACRALAQRQPGTAEVHGADDLDARQVREALRRCIARLPDGLQGVVLLRDLAEMPYAQVAATLGITVATARVYRHRALRLLSAWMTRQRDG